MARLESSPHSLYIMAVFRKNRYFQRKNGEVPKKSKVTRFLKSYTVSVNLLSTNAELIGEPLSALYFIYKIGYRYNKECC